MRFADHSGVVSVGTTHTQEVADIWGRLRLPSIAARHTSVNPPPQLDIRVLFVPAGCLLVSMTDLAQLWFAKRMSGDLHAERNPFG